MMVLRSILVLCTGNSVRSIISEAVLNQTGKVMAYSAGSHPAGKVNPLTTALLLEKGYEVEGLSSKSWTLFGAPAQDQKDQNPAAEEAQSQSQSQSQSQAQDKGSLRPAAGFDLIITVCDQAALEACPVWLGDPVKLSIPFADPAKEGGSLQKQQKAFHKTYQEIAPVMRALADFVSQEAEGPLQQERLLQFMQTR